MSKILKNGLDHYGSGRSEV